MEGWRDLVMHPPGRAPAQAPGEPFAKRHVTVNDLRSLRRPRAHRPGGRITRSRSHGAERSSLIVGLSP